MFPFSGSGPRLHIAFCQSLSDTVDQDFHVTLTNGDGLETLILHGTNIQLAECPPLLFNQITLKPPCNQLE